MNIQTMNVVEQHFENSFERPVKWILHPQQSAGVHIDILVFEPTAQFPFWKLTTMGVSEIVMPQKDKWGNR